MNTWGSDLVCFPVSVPQCPCFSQIGHVWYGDRADQSLTCWKTEINFKNQRRPLSLHCFHTSLNHCHLWPGSWSSFSTFIHCSHFLLLSPHRRQSDILAIFFFFKGKWSVIFFSFFKLINFLFLSALGLVTVRAFSLVVVSRDYSPVAVQRPVIAVTSLIAEHGLSSTQASIVVVHRLSCPKACGIFPDQGSNPCPLHWQADS